MHHGEDDGEAADRHQAEAMHKVVELVGADGHERTPSPKEERPHHAAHARAKAVEDNASGPHAEAKGRCGHRIDLPQPPCLGRAGPDPPRAQVGVDALLLEHQLERCPPENLGSAIGTVRCWSTSRSCGRGPASSSPHFFSILHLQKC